MVAKFGFLSSGQLPDPEKVEVTIRELFGRAEGLFYTIADAAVANSDAVASSSDTAKQSGDWLSGITTSLETVLKVLKDGLSALHVPYPYGFAIILLTVLVKAATFPFSKKQVESAMAMRSLQPQIKAIQQRYAGDPERIQLETARIYKLAGINPLAGCLPTLITIPVWIGLYRALSNVANEGLLSEGFFWIPSLAGPTTIAARQNGSGISWLFPFVDGHPPLGWSDTLAYLALPVLLVVSQYISMQIMQSSQPDDPSLKSSQAIMKFLPLMIGYFALSVPSGLSLYWLTNNILSTAQQVWLQKMGGAKNTIPQLRDDIFKEEKPQPQELAFKEEQTQPPKLSQTEEVSPSTGLRRGERFKQLKEEEARRKRQMQEANMKVEGASIQAASISKEEDKKQDSSVGAANGTAAHVVDGKNDINQSTASATNSVNGGMAVNGNVNEKGSREDENTTDLTKENGRPASDINDGREELVKEDLGKDAVEVQSRMGSRDETS